MKRIWIFLLILVLLTGCAVRVTPTPPDELPSKEEPASPETVLFEQTPTSVHCNDYDEVFPKTAFFTSREELDTYTEANAGLYLFSNGEDPSVDFFTQTEKMDSTFFENHDVLDIILREGSGSIRHEVRSVIKKGDTVTVKIDRRIPGSCTDDMACWHILLTLEKGVLSPADNVNVSLKEVLLYEEAIVHDDRLGYLTVNGRRYTQQVNINRTDVPDSPAYTRGEYLGKASSFEGYYKDIASVDGEVYRCAEDNAILLVHLENSALILLKEDGLVSPRDGDTVMVDGELYYATSHRATAIQDSVFIGIIVDSCDEGTLPTENGQSNFGIGYRYQRQDGVEGQIKVEFKDGTCYSFYTDEQMQKMTEEVYG